MRKYIVTIIIIAALGLIGYDRMSRCEAIGASAEPDPYQQGIAEKILRFHILANSDSDKDQKVKEKETVFLPDKKAHERFQAQFNKYRQLAYAANALDTGRIC